MIHELEPEPVPPPARVVKYGSAGFTAKELWRWLWLERTQQAQSEIAERLAGADPYRPPAELRDPYAAYAVINDTKLEDILGYPENGIEEGVEEFCRRMGLDVSAKYDFGMLASYDVAQTYGAGTAA